MSPSFIGIANSKSETQIGIVFTKMLSQLSNIQLMLSSMLEFGYGLELKLAGYDFKTIKVIWNASTITDDLKAQQGKEIKIRNLSKLWVDGVISKDTYADEMGYEEPDNDNPPILPGATDETPKAKKKEKREGDKDKSDRKVRDKNKVTPKRKDQNTKPV
jgi:hypothetical protein